MHSIMIGGAEVAILSAVPALVRKFDVTVIVLGAIDNTLLTGFSQKEKNIFKVFDYPIYKYPFILSSIISYILSLKPDIVIASLWRSAMIATIVKKMRKPIRFVTFVHNTDFPHFFAKRFNHLAVKSADLVLADSYSTYQFVKSAFKPKATLKQISFITNSTPSEFLERSISQNAQIRFLFLARITKVKNLPRAIEFISKLKDKGYDVVLDVYGRKADGYDDAFAKVDELSLQKVVAFKGEINPQQKYQLFEKYHFLIQMSVYEGMAMSVAEAMQYGLPCIVTPVGEIPNYAKDMQSAIFVDLNEPLDQSLLAKVERVIGSQAIYREISYNAHQQFLNSTTFDVSLVDCIEELS